MKERKWIALPDAGKHGGVIYDSITKEERIVPFSDYANFTSYCEPSPANIVLPNETIDNDLGQMERGYLSVVSDPTGPRLSTCLLGAKFKNGKVMAGTGWLINKRYVMTAGHMLYRSDEGYALHVAVYVAPSGGRKTAKQYRLGHKYHVAGDYCSNALKFDESSNEKYSQIGIFDDWGVVKLDKDLPDNTPILPSYSVGDAADMPGTYYTQGYPGEYGLNAKIEDWVDWYMYAESGTIDSNEYQRILGRVHIC